MKSLRVAWRPHEIQLCESIWCMLHKLCRWNSIHAPEIWQLLAMRNGAHEWNGSGRRRDSLLHSEWLDRAALADLLDLTAKQLADAFLDRYAEVFDLADLLLRGEVAGLRYCTECLLAGYHTPLYCLPLLDECPIHNTPLRDTCPSCSRAIQYAAPFGDAFTCSCGHVLWWQKNSMRLGVGELSKITEVISSLDLLAKGSFAQRKRHENVVAGTLSDDILTAVVSQYETYQKRLSSIVRTGSEHRAPSSEHEDAFNEGEKDLSALYAWRCYWDCDASSASPVEEAFSGKHIIARFREIAPSFTSSHGCALARRLMAAACLGTFLECLDHASFIHSMNDARSVGKCLKGVVVPFCLSTVAGAPVGKRAISRWLACGTHALEQFCHGTHPLS